MSYRDELPNKYVYVSAVGNYTVLPDDFVIAFGKTVGTSITATLPDAAKNKNRAITLRLSASNAVTTTVSIASLGGAVESNADGMFPIVGLDGPPSVGTSKLTQATRGLTYASDGVNWQIISSYVTRNPQ